jgi:hypothetical protein
LTGSRQENLRKLVEFIASSGWGTARAPSPESDRLAWEHTRRAREGIDALAVSRNLLPWEAYAHLQSVGADQAGYEQTLASLFDDIQPRGPCNQEYLILAAASALYWPSDKELSALDNPWLPVLELFYSGYNCGFVDTVDDQHIDFLLFYNQQRSVYRIV